MLGFCFLGHFSTCVQRTVRGTAMGTLTVHCTYGRGWESYKKWWCRGYEWDSCKILVKSTGSEQLVKKGRASIQDNHSLRIFTVTLEDLWYDDADTYWCGIEKAGNDLGYKVYVDVDPGRYYPSCALGPWVPPPKESGLFLCLPRWMKGSLKTRLRLCLPLKIPHMVANSCSSGNMYSYLG